MRIVCAVLHQEGTEGEGTAQRHVDDVESIGFVGLVNTQGCVIADHEATKVAVAAFAGVDGVGTIPLAGGNQVACTVVSVVESQSFQVGNQFGGTNGTNDRDFTAACGFGIKLDNTELAFYPNVDDARFLIHYDRFGLVIFYIITLCYGEFDRSHHLSRNRFTVRCRQFQLSHFVATGLGNKDVERASYGTAITR